MRELLKISYEQFLDFKAHKYNYAYIKKVSAKLLEIEQSAIIRHNFKYTRSYEVVLIGDLHTLRETHKKLEEQFKEKKVNKNA